MTSATCRCMARPRGLWFAHWQSFAAIVCAAACAIDDRRVEAVVDGNRSSSFGDASANNAVVDNGGSLVSNLGPPCSAEQGKDGTCSLALGAACTSGDKCASGFCVGKVCCDRECAGPCEHCSAAAGTCSEIASCECSAGTQSSCGIIAGSDGDCAERSVTCAPTGRWPLLTCAPQTAEACTDDGRDEDCDGAVNEGCQCTDGDISTCDIQFGALGECSRRPITCASGGWHPSDCSGEAELCDGEFLDEDCDGEANEGPECEAFTSISSAPGIHTCGVSTEGRVLCWGGNDYGQLGVGIVGASQRRPIDVAGIANAVSVATSRTQSCAVMSDGSAHCWGDNTTGALGDGTSQNLRQAPISVSVVTNIKAIAPNEFGSCAILQDGTVSCWSAPAAMPSTVLVRPVEGLEDVRSIHATGQSEHCALLGDGTVQCWTAFDLTPEPVPGISAATQVAIGVSGHCALVARGEVLCWRGQSVTHAPLAEPAIAIDASPTQMCALLRDRTLRCWGGGFGETAVPIEGLRDITGFSTGAAHTCAVLASGAAYCFGENLNGELGNPDTRCCTQDVLGVRVPPVRVFGP
jgi:hypothetical protein